MCQITTGNLELRDTNYVPVSKLVLPRSWQREKIFHRFDIYMRGLCHQVIFSVG